MKNLPLFFAFAMLSLQLSAQTPVFEIQGHRGARGLAPENTIPAFFRALDEGVHTLELDVVISKDRKVVVSHEPYFNPQISTFPNGELVTQETKGNTYQMPYRKIKQFDVGKRGNLFFPEQRKMAAYKPLLRKMLRASEAYAKEKAVTPPNYNIELKSLEEEYTISQPEVEEFSNLVVKIISKRLPPERVTIQSFDFNIIKFWHEQIKSGRYPKVSLSALIEPDDDNDIDYNLTKLGFLPDVWSPYFKIISKEKVAKLHEKGIRVIPWTVNEVADMKAVKEMGCDGLITDYPNRAKTLRE